MTKLYDKLIADLFRLDGHLNRKDYAYAQFRVLCISILGACILAIFMAIKLDVPFSSFLNDDIYFTLWILNFDRAPWLQIPLIIYWGICISLHCNNSFRRLKDIRGTDSNKLVWQAGVVALSLIPYGKLCLSTVFLIKEGVLSSPLTAIPLAQLMGQAADMQTGKSSDEIAKLYELKKSGAISDVEFQDMKRKLIDPSKDK